MTACMQVKRLRDSRMWRYFGLKDGLSDRLLEDSARPDLNNYQRAGRVSSTVAASAFIAVGTIAAVSITSAAVVGAPVILAGAAVVTVGLGVAWLGNAVWDKVKDPLFEKVGFD